MEKKPITDYIDKCFDIIDAQKIIASITTQYELTEFERDHLNEAFIELSKAYRSFYKKADIK